jgi:cytochrome c5
LSHDKQFMDLFTLIIGVLVAIAVGLGILAVIVGSKTQYEAVRNNPEYQQQVDEHLRPIGRVAVAGEAPPEGEAAPGPAVAAAPAPVAAPLSGPQVFNQACNACHGAGIGGAPKIGDKAAWGPRIAQGVDTLKKHALGGYQGKTGVMPAKGGFVNLSDAEVEAGVEYMVSQSK